MRKFWLELVGIDSAISLSGGEAIIGAEIATSTTALYLTRTSNAIVLTEPSGLGFEMHSPASAVGMGYVDTHDELMQPHFAGMLNFKRRGSLDPYGSYSSFMRLIDMYPTRLRYDPTGSGYDNAYLLPGKITKLTKSEIKASRLAVGMEFSASEPFYKLARKDNSDGTPITLAANTALSIAPRVGELSGYKNAFTATITLDAVPSAYFSARIYHSGSGQPVAVLDINKILSRNDVIVWSSDPVNPRVTVNGVDQISARVVDLGEEIFPSLSGTDLLFATDIATKIKLEYKGYRRSV